MRIPVRFLPELVGGIARAAKLIVLYFLDGNNLETKYSTSGYAGVSGSIRSLDQHRLVLRLAVLN